jgi:transposase
MLRPSFVPPREIRELRDYTRLRGDLIEERSRHKQRVEKLLEDALIKLSTITTDLFGKSGRAMLEALIDGERDPEVLAELALGKLRPKRVALREALTGRFDAHHAELARMLLDQIDALGEKIDRLTTRVDELVEQIPEACGHNASGERAGPSALERLDEIPGVGVRAAQIILAEVGLDMAQFPTAAHLVSWAKLSPRTIQSGPRTHAGRTGRGNPYLKGALGEAAAAAARTDTFLGERYRRLVRRRGHQRALVAVARSILVIVWHLLEDQDVRFVDLGSDFYERRLNKERRARDLVRQLQALGHTVTLSPAA